MKNKPKSDSKKKNVPTYSLSTSITGLAISVLLGLIIAMAVWGIRIRSELPMRTTWSNFFTTPGVVMLVFGVFWWMSRKGYGSTWKYHVHKRALRKRIKHGEKIDPRERVSSPFEYNKIHANKLNTCLIGFWINFGIGASFLLIGIIIAFS